MSQLARAAMAYAERLGWPVFPLQPRDKNPRISRDDGGRGYLDATTDVRQIHSWWQRWPDANIGVACDQRSGLLALDVDPRSYGDEELSALELKHGHLPDTAVQLTGGGGVHHLFRHPGGGRWAGRLCPGVDVKAAGYIVAAPSVHPSGSEYTWEHELHPLRTRLSRVPRWVLRRISQPGGFFEKSRVPQRRGRSGDARKDSFLEAAFRAAGWLGDRIDDHRCCVRCPWEIEHTVNSPPSSTILWAPTSLSPAGVFWCSHSHCDSRTLDDVVKALPSQLILSQLEQLRRETAERIRGSEVAQCYEDEERSAIQAEGAAA